MQKSTWPLARPATIPYHIDSEIEKLQDVFKKNNHCLSSIQIKAIRNMMADYAVSASMDSAIRTEAEEICAENYRIEVAKEKIRSLKEALKKDIIQKDIDFDTLWDEVNNEYSKKITVHGFEDWHPTIEEWQKMLDNVQMGANGECDVTIDGVTKTMKEWQSNPTTKN